MRRPPARACASSAPLALWSRPVRRLPRTSKRNGPFGPCPLLHWNSNKSAIAGGIRRFGFPVRSMASVGLAAEVGGGDTALTECFHHLGFKPVEALMVMGLAAHDQHILGIGCAQEPPAIGSAHTHAIDIGELGAVSAE